MTSKVLSMSACADIWDRAERGDYDPFWPPALAKLVDVASTTPEQLVRYAIQEPELLPAWLNSVINDDDFAECVNSETNPALHPLVQAEYFLYFVARAVRKLRDQQAKIYDDLTMPQIVTFLRDVPKYPALYPRPSGERELLHHAPGIIIFVAENAPVFPAFNTLVEAFYLHLLVLSPDGATATLWYYGETCKFSRTRLSGEVDIAELPIGHLLGTFCDLIYPVLSLLRLPDGVQLLPFSWDTGFVPVFDVTSLSDNEISDRLVDLGRTLKYAFSGCSGKQKDVVDSPAFHALQQEACDLVRYLEICPIILRTRYADITFQRAPELKVLDVVCTNKAGPEYAAFVRMFGYGPYMTLNISEKCTLNLKVEYIDFDGEGTPEVRLTGDVSSPMLVVQEMQNYVAKAHFHLVCHMDNAYTLGPDVAQEVSAMLARHERDRFYVSADRPLRQYIGQSSVNSNIKWLIQELLDLQSDRGELCYIQVGMVLEQLGGLPDIPGKVLYYVLGMLKHSMLVQPQTKDNKALCDRLSELHEKLHDAVTKQISVVEAIKEGLL